MKKKKNNSNPFEKFKLDNEKIEALFNDKSLKNVTSYLNSFKNEVFNHLNIKKDKVSPISRKFSKEFLDFKKEFSNTSPTKKEPLKKAKIKQKLPPTPAPEKKEQTHQEKPVNIVINKDMSSTKRSFTHNYKPKPNIQNNKTIIKNKTSHKKNTKSKKISTTIKKPSIAKKLYDQISNSIKKISLAKVPETDKIKKASANDTVSRLKERETKISNLQKNKKGNIS